MNLQEFLKTSHLAKIIKIPTTQTNRLHGELQGFCSILENKNRDTIEKMLMQIFEYKAAFPETYKLLCGAQLFRGSTAACENSFSCLQRILSKQRLSLTQCRKSSLIPLESDITNNIDPNDFLTVLRTNIHDDCTCRFIRIEATLQKFFLYDFVYLKLTKSIICCYANTCK